MPTTVLLVESDPRLYLDLARLGVTGNNPLDAIKTHAVGAALLVLANQLGSKEADVYDDAVSQKFSVAPMLLGGVEGLNDFAWSESEQSAITAPAHLCVPPPRPSTPEEWALMQLSGVRFPRDLTDHVIPSIRAATNLFGDGEPGHGIPRVRNVANGHDAIIVFNGSEYISAKRWPGIEAPTLAGMLRSRSLCAAVTLLIAKRLGHYDTRSPSCAGNHAGGRIRVVPAEEVRARSWYPINDIVLGGLRRLDLL